MTVVVKYCGGCGRPTLRHDLYVSGRCKRLFCPACLDTLLVHTCTECAVIKRDEEIRRRMSRSEGRNRPS